MSAFALTKGYTSDTTVKRRVTVHIKEDYIVELVAIKVTYINLSESLGKVHQTTDSDKTVLKILYKGRDGIYYNDKARYGVPKKRRIYLTDPQIEDLLEYLLKLKRYYRKFGLETEPYEHLFKVKES